VDKLTETISNQERLIAVIAADFFCGNWGLNPCQFPCDDCRKKAIQTIYDQNIPSDIPWKEAVKLVGKCA